MASTHVREPDASTDVLAHAVIGAALEVHRLLGPGFLEEVYEEALCVELRLRGIPHERQKRVRVDYKGEPVGEGRIDLLVGNQLVVELKAVKAFAPIDRAKVISYRRLTGRHLALLINFHVPVLKDGIQRVVQS
ncbi:MAG: GxxExxY protein [Planctomycetota bacterium]|nr:GxxExxY protein [Planctomycetota bacterium]